MKATKRFILMLAAMIGMTGVWAQATDDEVAVTKGADNQWTLTMPEYDVELEIEYYSNMPFDLNVGESLHGTVVFSVGGEAVTKAEKDDVVTVTVTPDEGYSQQDVTVRAYTSWGAAARARRAPGVVDEIEVTKQQDGTWQFTMPEANVWVVVTYTKNLQDAWIQDIANQTYTGVAIEPIITVKDGETTLTLGTDYTVAYANNVSDGTATVTATGTGNYSGTATATFTILTNKTGLNTAISDAESYYNSIKDSNPDAAATLLEAINTAKGIQSKADAAQSEIETALSTITTAQETAEETVLEETKTALDNAIKDAEEYYNSIKDSNPEIAAELLISINAAKEALSAPDATQEEISNALTTQTQDLTIATTKTTLDNAIKDAEEYYNSIKDSNPEAAAELLVAINDAKDAMDDPNATPSAISDVLTTFSEAVSTATVEVSRVTITIPAKSYVARIDGDKRQIDMEFSDAAGVSLYTVKSVTDSEVELSTELNVVAAGMPYLIYNDNDEAKTISIVVSEEEADEVEYDSEHFKGTLEEKTFTDEDMEAADHYVLSNGKDFVWVKDAGTLAAGKCWIELIPSSEAPARRLTIVHENELLPTGINAVATGSNEAGAWYDLNGRRVAQPTKGLFIRNGKKILVK